MSTNAADAGLRSHRVRVAWLVFGVGVALTVGWPISAALTWDDLVHTKGRLGYAFGDYGLVMPLCYATWWSLWRGRAWGPGMLLCALGAGAYDVIHFTVFLIQGHEAPAALLVVVAVAVLGALGYMAQWEIRRLRPSGAGS